jgi:muramoyltetrapeptide carboxypeptidase
MIRLGIVATSSVIPKVEFEFGIDFLRKKGFHVEVHPTVLGEYYFYPAPDEVRAQALIESAMNPDLDALWCARGGYGATHLLPFLNRAKKKLQSKKIKKKTLLGYSDATALLEWFRVNLGWNTIHAPMPSLRTFSLLSSEEWSSVESLLMHATLKKKSGNHHHQLSPIFIPKGFKGAQAPLVGGNLFVWNSLIGTKDQGNARGKILFLEEISENMGRINRMMHHLEQSGGLKGVKAIVLGDFMDCLDTVPSCLIHPPQPGVDLKSFLRSPPQDAMGPLRKAYPSDQALNFVFKSLGERNQIAVFKGLPVGHGPHYQSLYLGKKHSLSVKGEFKLIS